LSITCNKDSFNISKGELKMTNDRISAQQWAKIEQQMRTERSLAFHKMLNLPTIILNKLKSAQNNQGQNHIATLSNA